MPQIEMVLQRCHSDVTEMNESVAMGITMGTTMTMGLAVIFLQQSCYIFIGLLRYSLDNPM